MKVRKTLMPIGPATVVRKTVKYSVDQEHFLRRISSGILIHWDSLPSDLQDLIIDQALVVDDRHAHRPTTLEIENFIRTVKLTKLHDESLVAEGLAVATAEPVSNEGNSAFSFSK
jgi:hypothetical protein